MIIIYLPNIVFQKIYYYIFYNNIKTIYPILIYELFTIVISYFSFLLSNRFENLWMTNKSREQQACSHRK